MSKAQDDDPCLGYDCGDNAECRKFEDYTPACYCVDGFVFNADGFCEAGKR